MAVAMIALLLLPFVSQADTPVVQGKTESATAEPTGDDAVQPKFIWGILIKFAATKAFETFGEWTVNKLFKGMAQPLTLPRGAAVSQPGAAVFAPTPKDATPILPNITDTAPSAPLVVENGKESYQGALLALLVLQPGGRTLKVRPISEGFKSGEKFRIRIGTTFDGDLTLDNIDPQGQRSRLYPENAEQIVKIKGGAPVILPLEKDGFFEFDDVAGEEKLVISLRDPRAVGEAAAPGLAHRHETEQGTGLLQDISAGKFPSIAESIALQHRQ